LSELGSLGVIEGIHDLQQPTASTTEVQGFFPEDASRTVLEEALGHHIREIAEIFPVWLLRSLSFLSCATTHGKTVGEITFRPLKWGNAS